MPRWYVIRGYLAGVIALTLLALSFLLPLVLGIYLGVLVEQWLCIRPIFVTLIVFFVLVPVLLRMMTYQLKAGTLGRALERIANGSNT